MADFVSLTDTRHAGSFKLKTLSQEPAPMINRTNRGRLLNPDRRGCVRPEVGGKRFIVGNIKNVSISAMER